MRSRFGVLALCGLVLAAASLLDAHAGIFAHNFFANGAPVTMALVGFSYLGRETKTYDATQEKLSFKLDNSNPYTDIRILIQGSLTVTNAGADNSAVLDDHVQRLVSSMVLEAGPNSEPVVNQVALRDMHQIWMHHIYREPTQVPVTAVAAGGPYSFRLHTGITFSPSWGRDLTGYLDRHMPATPRKDSWLHIYLNRDRAVGVSDKGTAAFYVPGADTSAFTTVPTFTVEQVAHPRMNNNGGQPMLPAFVPHYASWTSNVWDGVQADWPHDLIRSRTADLHLIRQTYDGNSLAQLENSITNLRLQGKSKATGATQNIIEKTSALSLRAWEQENNYSALSATGYLMLLFSRDGRSSSALNANQYTDLKYICDLADPTSGNGKLTFTAQELLTPDHLL